MQVTRNYYYGRPKCKKVGRVQDSKIVGKDFDHMKNLEKNWFNSNSKNAKDVYRIRKTQ